LQETNNTNNTDNTTKSTTHQQEYERYFPDLNLTLEEDEFFHNMMVQRMEMHAQLDRQRSRVSSKAETQAWLAEDEAFYDLMKRLPHEDSLIINRHDAALNNRQVDKCDFYYRAGFLDGLKLARFVREA